MGSTRTRFSWWGLLLIGCSAAAPRPSAPPVMLPPDPFPPAPVRAGGLTFDVRTAGPADGVPVLLLHGFPETSYEWRAQLAALGAAGFRAVAPDQRGYSPGARPAAVEDYQIVRMVKDAIRIADALGLGRFHVVGHDWGAAVAWGLAMGAPERVRTLTAISIPHPAAMQRALADAGSCQHRASAYFDQFAAPRSEEWFLANDAWLLKAAYAGFADDVRARYLAVLGTPAALGAALNWYRANVAHRQVVDTIEAGNLKVGAPTLLVWSDKDPYICRATIEASAAYVSGPFHLEILRGVGHFVPESAPAEVTRLLLEHLRR